MLINSVGSDWTGYTVWSVLVFPAEKILIFWPYSLDDTGIQIDIFIFISLI